MQKENKMYIFCTLFFWVMLLLGFFGWLLTDHYNIYFLDMTQVKGIVNSI